MSTYICICHAKLGYEYSEIFLMMVRLQGVLSPGRSRPGWRPRARPRRWPRRRPRTPPRPGCRRRSLHNLFIIMLHFLSDMYVRLTKRKCHHVGRKLKSKVDEHRLKTRRYYISENFCPTHRRWARCRLCPCSASSAPPPSTWPRAGRRAP